METQHLFYKMKENPQETIYCMIIFVLSVQIIKPKPNHLLYEIKYKKLRAIVNNSNSSYCLKWEYWLTLRKHSIVNAPKFNTSMNYAMDKSYFSNTINILNTRTS